MNEKSILCVFFFFNDKHAHWVGHSQLRSLDTDYLFKRTPGVDEKQASVTLQTNKQSVYGVGNNSVLLQKEEKMYLRRLMMILI